MSTGPSKFTCRSWICPKFYVFPSVNISLNIDYLQSEGHFRAIHKYFVYYLSTFPYQSFFILYLTPHMPVTNVHNAMTLKSALNNPQVT